MRLADLIRALVKRPNGLCATDLPGSNKAANAALYRLRAEIYKAKVGHKTVRYFDSAEKAAAYVFVTPKPPTHRAGGVKSSRPGWGPSDPAHITSETKVTIAPPPPRSFRSNTYPVW